MRAFFLRRVLVAFLLLDVFVRHILALLPPASLSTHYWDRLGLDPSTIDTHPTGNKLAQIHEAHLYNICFENLAQHGAVGGPPVLDVKVLADKILIRKRGGFCFELNGLLAEFLTELGYPSVQRVPAQVCIGTDDTNGSLIFRDQPNHMILLVKDCDDIQWFVDVGFGESPLCPLRYDKVGIEDEALPQTTPDGMKSRLRMLPEEQVVRLEWYKEGQWQTRLQWTVQDSTRNKALEEFSTALDYVLRAESTFSQKLICCRLTRAQKITVAGNQLKVTGPPRFSTGLSGGACLPGPPTTVTTCESVDEVRAVLEATFDIPLQQTLGLDLRRSLQAPERIWSTL